MNNETQTKYRATRQGIDEFEDTVWWAEKYMEDILHNVKIKPKAAKIEIREEFKGSWADSSGCCADLKNEASDQPVTYCAEVDIEFGAELDKQ